MSDFTYERMGAKLMRRTGFYGTREAPVPTIAHWCPACGSMHDYAVEAPFLNGARWHFDGDLEAPSFTPSMNISWGPNSRGETGRCHYFVTDGEVRYCGDSTHRPAGQNVPLPDIPRDVLIRSGFGVDL